MSRCVDKTGQRFGKLVVISLDHYLPGGKGSVYNCLCDCGNVTLVRAGSLSSRRSSVKSCGCLRTGPKEYNALPGKEASINTAFSQYKDSAIKRGKAWQLSKEEFILLSSQNCHYCDFPPSLKSKARNEAAQYVFSGLDRVDNNIGYIFDNCVPACKFCNYAKRTMTTFEFEEWLNRLNAHKHYWPLKQKVGNLPPPAKYSLYGF